MEEDNRDEVSDIMPCDEELREVEMEKVDDMIDMI